MGSSFSIGTAVRQHARTVHAYTKPRPTTAGNFEKSDYLQAVGTGAIEGFYMLGPVGALSAGGAALTGVVMRRHNFGKVTSAMTSAATGAALAAAAGHFLGTGSIGLAVMGGVCGAYACLRGDKESRLRDAGFAGLTYCAPFLPGPGKAAVGIAAAVAAHCESDWARAAVGGSLGGAIGVGLALSGLTGATPLVAGLAGATAGALGPIIGPRLTQVMRNVYEDVGQRLNHNKSDEPTPADDHRSRVYRSLGAVPVAFAKEMVLATILADGNWAHGLIGGVVDASMGFYTMYRAKVEDSPAGLDGHQEVRGQQGGPEPIKVELQKSEADG